MRTNVKPASPTTHEGGRSVTLGAAAQLRRTVMANLLFEDSFYESGVDAAKRIADLLPQVSFDEAAAIAIDAREKMKLRHVPLLLTRELLRNHGGRKVGDLIYSVIQRPDEMAELLALYWKDGKEQPLTAQMKIGLARAFKKFDEYALAKWDKDGAVRLRDVLFQAHVRPFGADPRVPYTRKERKHAEKYKLNRHEELLKRVTENKLATPDTWEVGLSGGANKKEAFTRLLSENKLGALALLRNLRNMIEAGVDNDLIRAALQRMKVERVLPFRFITAARYAPRLEQELEQAMFKCLADLPKLPGNTALLVDHSQSMNAPVSAKSEVTRFEAAAALGMILRETAQNCRVFTFSDSCVEIPPRRGFGMLDALNKVRRPQGTLLGTAVKHVYKAYPECSRIIVVTDEQSADRPPQPQGTGYIINVAGYQQGIGYGPWVTIDGWSENVLRYIEEYENHE